MMHETFLLLMLVSDVPLFAFMYVDTGNSRASYPVYSYAQKIATSSGGRSCGGGGICNYRQKRVTADSNEYVHMYYPAGSSQR